MSEPKSSTCTRLSQVMGISHDSVNRFLLRESYEPQDLFNEAKKLLDVVGGTLNVDVDSSALPTTLSTGLTSCCPGGWPSGSDSTLSAKSQIKAREQTRKEAKAALPDKPF